MNNENVEHISAEQEDSSIKEIVLKVLDWWQYLWSKWLIIVLFGLLGGLLGLAYAILKKPTYTATTTFVLEDEKSGGGLGNLAGLASMAGVDIGGGGGGIFQGENILSLYRSRTMLEKTLLTSVQIEDKKMLLIDRYIDFNKLREKWAAKPELATLNFGDALKQNNQDALVPNRLRDSVLGVVVNGINKGALSVFKPDKKLSTIQVDVKAKDELFAKAFNDALVRNVNEFYIETKTKKTIQNVDILQHKTDSVRSVMNGAIYTAVAVADATPNLNPTRQVQRVAPAQKAQFSAETNRNVLSEMVKNLELTKMALLRETPLIQVVDQPIYPLKKDKVSKVISILIGGIFLSFLLVMFLIIKYEIRKLLK